MTIVEGLTATAACEGADLELFFDDARTTEARRVCFGCPVRQACLESACDRQEPSGVWGGLTATERNLVGAKRMPKSALVVHACGDCDAPLTFPLSPVPTTGTAPGEGEFAVDGDGGIIIHAGDLRRRTSATISCCGGHELGEMLPDSVYSRLSLSEVIVRRQAPLAARGDAA